MDQKLVEIKPLPEANAPSTKDGEDIALKALRAKPGRKFDPNAKTRKKTGDTYTMTEKRKQGLLKARMSHADKRKRIQDEIERIMNEASDASAENLMAKSTEDIKDKPAVEVISSSTSGAEPHLHARIGDLENQLKTINEQLGALLSTGVFNGHNVPAKDSQTFQTTPAEPTEFKRPDIFGPAASYMRSNNGGMSSLDVMPTQENREPTPAHVKHSMPTPFFF